MSLLRAWLRGPMFCSFRAVRGLASQLDFAAAVSGAYDTDRDVEKTHRLRAKVCGGAEVDSVFGRALSSIPVGTRSEGSV